MWEKVLVNEGSEFVHVAEIEKEVVGFLSAGPARAEELDYDGEIYGFYIEDQYQDQGIGKELFKAAVNKFKDYEFTTIFVWVLKENPAVKFYRKMGGKKVEEANLEIGGKEYKELALGWDDINN